VKIGTLVTSTCSGWTSETTQNNAP